MKYLSTRGSGPVSSSEAILRGLAPDSGLYVPETFPVFGENDIRALCPLSYAERAVRIIGAYLTDWTEDELRADVNAAYGERFDDRTVAPLRRLNGDEWMLELFHGPTLAFKDMALQLLPRLVRRAAKKNGETREISILVATSGDTGKAALEGFRDVPGTSCTVIYPKDGVSDVQRLQMVTTGGANTHVIAVEGNFDDAQAGVKRLFASADFSDWMNAEGRVLSSANSINFGRLVPQIVYYFSAYADLLKEDAIAGGEEISFCVPTGNFGDILAGYYAKRMGLPVGRLICASNRNDVLTEFFRTGTYNARRPFHTTISPSMDILVSSNLERLLFEICGRDAAQVRAWMTALKDGGSYVVSRSQLAALRHDFAAGCADDETTCGEIRRRFTDEHALIDTHTAVAARVLRELRADGEKTVIVSTASPYKFAADVLKAVSSDAAVGDTFACADALEQLSGVPVPECVRALRSLPVRHNLACRPDTMAEAVFEALGGGRA